MTETGWQAIGRIAKARRERLGLKQDQLALYGGPAVATVGKFERAAQPTFPLRTQHQMEKALGWTRTTVEQVVNSIDEGALAAEDWEYDLIEENIPDLSRPAEPAGVGVDSFAAVFRLVPFERQEAAMRAAVRSLLDYIEDPRGGEGHADASAGGSASIAGEQIDIGSGRPRAEQHLEVDE